MPTVTWRAAADEQHDVHLDAGQHPLPPLMIAWGDVDSLRTGSTKGWSTHQAEAIATTHSEIAYIAMHEHHADVHIEHRVPTSPWVESGGVGVAIGEEHRESTRKHGQGEQEQNVGDEHAPHKQGNSKHFLTRAAHLQAPDSID